MITENMKFWLKNMYDTEIEEANVAAANERIFAKGTFDAELAAQHESYAVENSEYAKLLEKLKAYVDTLD